MPSDAEILVDRRRLRRKVSFWRVLAVLAAVAAVVVAGWRFGAVDAGGRLAATRDHVARVAVTGLILSDRDVVEMLDRLGETPSARGVVVSINSPGGTVTGSEELFAALRRLAERKPLVAFVDGAAASGGYMTALAADRIVARQTAIVGSIGVIFQAPNVVGLLDRLGIAVTEVKSAPLKAAPSPVSPTDPAAVAALQDVVNDTFFWFRDLVGERRGLSGDALARVSDGRVFSGRQGVGLGLVDSLGTERDAIAWLEEERGVPTGLSVRDWEPDRRRGPFGIGPALAAGASLAGFDGLAGWILRAEAFARVYDLDGMLALWQPSAEISEISSR